MSNAQQTVKVVPVIEPEALEYAKAEGLEAVVQRLVQATQRVFPTVLSIRVRLIRDVEVADLLSVMFEARVPEGDVPNYLEAHRRWGEEWLQAYPYPRNHSLFLRLVREPS